MNPSTGIRLSWLGAAALYLAALLILTHIPSMYIQIDLNRFHIDKLFHAGAYAILAWLVFHAGPTRRLAALGILTAIAVSDEWTQPFFGRASSGWDLAADLAGIGLCLLLCRPVQAGGKTRSCNEM